MKKLLAVLIFITILFFVVYKAIGHGGLLRDKLFSDLQLIKGLSIPEAQVSKKESSGETVALFFKDGSVMVGELIGRTEDEYIIDWKGQETVVFAGGVERVGSAREALKDRRLLSDEEISEWWPYDNDIVIRRTNGVVLDAKIKQIGEDSIGLIYLLEDGGYIEHDIERSKIEYLIFKPIENEESKNIEEMLRQLFPSMEFYRVGNFTVMTDSDVIWAKEYIATLKNAYTNIYFEFFDLFKDRKPRIQNFLVIFDDYVDYIEYAVTDGVPGWAASGYFKPDDKVLYLFNMLGDRFSEILFEAVIGESGKELDDIVEKVEGLIDKRYHIFLEGQAKVIKDKYWKVYSYYKNMCRKATMNTLRHEFAHELFYNWGLQNIILSKVKKDNKELVEKKKEFLETEDYSKKLELVKGLMSMRSQAVPLDTRAANSWPVEGLATYCETNPPGSVNKKLLFYYQEMARKQAVNPLEYLTVYKMGSFPGVYSETMLYLYAESWAFVSFLMEKYPEEFMEYQRKMAQESAQEYEDITWLLEFLNKDLRVVEEEFLAYMATFEELEDPFVSHFEKLYFMFRD